MSSRSFGRTASSFVRRQPVEMLGVAVFVATAEDTIIAKLEWSKLAGGSERQRTDVAGILATHAVLDRPYLERWVRELDLEDEWQYRPPDLNLPASLVRHAAGSADRSHL